MDGDVNGVAQTAARVGRSHNNTILILRLIVVDDASLRANLTSIGIDDKAIERRGLPRYM